MQNTITKNYTVIKQNSFKHSVDSSLLNYVELRLNKIFSDEVNSSDSIFLKVKQSAIHKMALFLSGSIKRSCQSGLPEKQRAVNQQLHMI